MKTKALAIRREPPKPVLSGIPNWVFFVGLGVLIWWLFKGRQQIAGTYHNAETWDVTWSEDGLPTKVVIHRDAVQT